MLPQSYLRIHVQDATSRRIKQRNDARGICRDYAIGNGSKDVVPVLFVVVDLLHRPGEASEETSIVDGNSGLVAKGKQQFSVFGIKTLRNGTTINVDRANTRISDNQWRAHERADTISLHARRGIVQIRVSKRPSGLDYLLHRTQADLLELTFLKS